jgi:glutathione S-transferase
MTSFIESGFTTRAEWLAAGGGATPTTGSLQMTYFPIAGRGELCRLIAAAGGLTLNEDSALPEGESKAEYFSPSGVPLLKHGSLRMSQSLAIEAYLINLSPKFSGLTAQQKAVDGMYGGIKEEMLLNCAKAIFTTKKTAPEQAKEDVTKLLDKWFALFEANLPRSGFVHGLGYPTGSDCAVLNITTAYMPYGAAMKFAEYDSSLSKFPKVKAHADRTAAALGSAFPTKFTSANPFGM